MSNQLRKFKRKAQKEFTDTEYQKQKTKERIDRRYKDEMKNFIEKWKVAVKDNVPIIFPKIAQLVMPKWYFKIQRKIAGIPSKKYLEKIFATAASNKWGTWRFKFNTYPLFAIGWFVDLITGRWLRFIHRKIYTFGISKKVSIDKKGNMVMTIKHYFTEIYRTEVKL